jgi:hypothetical protein
MQVLIRMYRYLMLNLRPFSRNKNEKNLQTDTCFEILFLSQKCNVQSLPSINDLKAPGETSRRPVV